MSEVMNTPVVAEAVANASSYNWGGLIARGAILGVAIGVGWFFLSEYKKKQKAKARQEVTPKPDKHEIAWEELLKKLAAEQKVMDILGLKELYSWMKAYQQSAKAPVRYHVMRPTAQNLAKIKFCAKEQLDPKHSMLVIVTTADKNKYLHMQMFTFGSMEEKLETLLDQKNGILVVDPA